MKKSISLLLLVAVLILSCACSPKTENAPVNLKKGETVQLLANDIYSKLGDDAVIEWTSSDESVVTVDSGKITYVKEGVAVITANGTSADGKKTYKNEFNVKCLSANGGVTLDKYSACLVNDSDSVTVTATLSDESDRIKKWSSSDETVATVVDGKITRVSKGRAEIKVETSLGYEAICYVICDSVVMKLGDVEITDAMYAYWLASYKTQVIEYNIGYDSPEIWATEVDEDGTTFEEMFIENVHTSIEQMLESVYVYYQNNEALSEELAAEVDIQIQQAIDANGNKEALDKLLSPFYADVDLLKKIFIFEEITNYVYEGMFGENGTDKIAEESVEEFFYDNYTKAQHIFFDMNYKFDNEGSYSYLSDTEKEDKRVLADEVWTKIQNGDLDYDAAVKEYSDDTEDTYDGFVFTEGEYDDSFTECVNGMEVGEIKYFETTYGIHIIKKLGLTKEDISEDIGSMIEEMLKMEIFEEKLSVNGENITVLSDLKYDLANMPMFSSTEE